MAYSEEGVIRTTLLEGSVRMSTGDDRSNSVTLIPNEQARLAMDGKLGVVEKVSVDEAVAWKNDLFMFKDTGLHAIMRQIERSVRRRGHL